MGTSAITSIYSALAGLAPTYDSDVTVRVQSIGKVNEFAHTDDLPMRKLQAFQNESGSEMAFLALGTTVTVTWTVVDRFLMRHANQGAGWEEFADELTLYCASYINILKSNRALTCGSHVENVSFRPGIFTFPEGSAKRIAGVDVILTISEVIS
jgi:hypothetical protein